jgi:MFS family permease
VATLESELSRPTLPVPASPAKTGSILLLSASIASAWATRTVFSPMQEIAKADLRLSDFQVSLVQGLAASIPIALLSIPLGRLVDHRNRVHLLMAVTAVSTLGGLMTAFAHSFPVLFVARMLAGLGGMCALPMAISITADLAQPDRRGRAILILSVGQIIGVAGAFAISGWLFGALTGQEYLALSPWRIVHVAFALFGFATMLSLIRLREPERLEIGDGVELPLRDAIREMWQRRSLLVPLLVGQVSVVMADTAATIWAAPVLSRDYGLSPTEFSAWIGAIILVAGLLGASFGGFAADYGHRSRIPGGLMIGAVISAGLSIPAAFFPVMPSVGSFAAMLTLLLMCGAATGLITATAIATLVPNEIRGLCLGLFVVGGAVIGLAVAPTLVSLLGSAIGGAHGLSWGLAATGLATGIAALIGFVRSMVIAGRDAAALELR